jgi:outer membrane protein assembly factor BamB
MYGLFSSSRALTLAVLSVALTAADWPQWRGPNRDGISQETGLLKEWPSGGPKLVWQVKDMGDGYSTPAVVGSRLYVMSSTGMDNEMVKALSTTDGKEIWSVKIGKVGPNTPGNNYPGPRCTPTVDGERVYVLGSDGDLACLEAATGKIAWHTNIRGTFGGKPGQWAYAESVLIDGDTLVCTPGGPTATIVALNKTTGAPLWTCAVPEADQAAYASVTIVNAGGVKQYVQFLQKGLVGVEAKTGKLLWRYEGSAKGSPANIPTPVSRDDFVYSASGRGGGGLVQLKAAGGGFEAVEVYLTSKLPTAIGGAVLVGGNLYGTTGQGLLCADFATGDVKWQERGVGAGSVCFADGRLYVHGENSGEMALVEATPEAYREKGRFTPPEAPTPTARTSLENAKSGRAWTYPIIANGRLYLRDWNCLWCFDVKAQ